MQINSKATKQASYWIDTCSYGLRIYSLNRRTLGFHIQLFSRKVAQYQKDKKKKLF